ncbi:hypothetical protein CANCADRAFT_4485 [Tortispora caseinolytica NRRL Y-17796]|uniref:U2 small nuclear ribonucleoprotein A' n=1 Tax=Tortispora caseinolytica NRRL Y-17796 TaxID=767744 RepID=A0A1E4T9C1_9ASCO|nr:hypothetical protein CANCADRAFT_4485 [Tortispora caseinolytica NRRL Y-17796]
MRLTPDTILGAQSYLNAIDERELNLRGLKIPVLEHLGATRDLNDSIDATDNDLRVLSGFGCLKRLKTLLVAKNRIKRINSSFGESAPNLTTLVLAQNEIDSFEALAALSQCSKLTYISLLDNPVTNRPNYRLWLIHRVPTLRVIDFRKVKDAERRAAAALFGTLADPSDAATAVLSGDDNADTHQAHPSINNALTDEERQKLERELEAATSLAEIERIERQLQMGYS